MKKFANLIFHRKQPQRPFLAGRGQSAPVKYHLPANLLSNRLFFQ